MYCWQTVPVTVGTLWSWGVNARTALYRTAIMLPLEGVCGSLRGSSLPVYGLMDNVGR